ncbi:MBL fold metallo-hydrolase [bacterium D16-51]|nr:MBL fold metallo-hydrolase [bacterium D16-59]RKI61938.1 MBL fold metallo-hydrolase [bacterium D16-51]
MVLKCLGSSSAGNCYLLESEKECLILECGVSMKEVKKTLHFDLRKVVGCIATHGHKDHIGYLKDFLAANIPIYTNDETAEKAEVIYGELLHGMPEKRPFHLGGFRITPFYVPHDGTPCFAYQISHEEIGRLLFLTDLEYCKYKFKDISQILIEANYSSEIIKQSNPNFDHVIKGHMELQTTLDFLYTNDNPSLMNVVLLHLSDSNSDLEYFKQKAKEVVPGANVYVADAGTEIKLCKEPF